MRIGKLRDVADLEVQRRIDGVEAARAATLSCRTPSTLSSVLGC